MFDRYKKNEEIKFEVQQTNKRPERRCVIYISSKFKQVIFVPMVQIYYFTWSEQDEVFVCDWPMKIEEIQHNIEKTLNLCKINISNLKKDEIWKSYEVSKAKSMRSFKVEYIRFSLITDNTRKYGEKEVERITIEAHPFDVNNDIYKLTGISHLLELQPSELVIDIFRACEKIRNN